MQQIMTEKVAHKLTNQTTNNKRKTDRHNICDVVCYYYGYWYDNVEYNMSLLWVGFYSHHLNTN